MQRQKKKKKYNRHRSLDANSKGYEETTKSPDECDVILVQMLMKMLLHPKSPEQQEYIVCLLKSDERLTKIFIDEKAKMGKTNVPVFKMRQTASETWNHSNIIEQHKTENHQIAENGDAQRFANDDNNVLEDNSTYSLMHFLNNCTTTSDFVVSENVNTSETENAVDYVENVPII